MSENPRPKAVESERAIIAAILSDTALFDNVADRLKEGAFYDPVLRKLWVALPELIERSRGSVDAYELAELLQGDALPGFRVGGDVERKAEIRAEIIGLPSHWTGFLESHVEAVSSAWRRRRILTAAEQAINRADDPNQDPDEILADLAELVATIEAVDGGGLPVSYDLPAADQVERSQRDWLIPGWLPGGCVTLFSGRGGAGKSRLSLQVAGAVALGHTGKPWDPDIEPRMDGRNVLVVSWEDEASEVFRRLLQAGAVCGFMPYNKLRESGRLRMLDMQGHGPLWEADRRGILTATGAGRYLMRTAASWRTGLLIIDPLASAFGGNENDRAQVRQFVGYLDAWARQNICAVLIIGHAPKYSGAAYSGSTDWEAAARCLWRFEAEKDAVERTTANKVLEVEKSNYAEIPDPVTLERIDGAWVRAEQRDEPEEDNGEAETEEIIYGKSGIT